MYLDIFPGLFQIRKLEPRETIHWVCLKLLSLLNVNLLVTLEVASATAF